MYMKQHLDGDCSDWLVHTCCLNENETLLTTTVYIHPKPHWLHTPGTWRQMLLYPLKHSLIIQPWQMLIPIKTFISYTPVTNDDNCLYPFKALLITHPWQNMQDNFLGPQQNRQDNFYYSKPLKICTTTFSMPQQNLPDIFFYAS